jgi:cytoskeletal protein CcmA (bactofilin family)
MARPAAREGGTMIKFRSRPTTPEAAPPATTILGVGANFRGTLMVTGTLRIDGEFEGDILSCERLEIGVHGVMRSDVEVKEAVVEGRVLGNIRALGTLEMKAGARVEGDVAAMSVIIEPGVFFTGRCTMLEHGVDSVEIDTERSRPREFARD